eukprot:408164-Pleurochrysis_carterae.AAC.1
MADRHSQCMARAIVDEPQERQAWAGDGMPPSRTGTHDAPSGYGTRTRTCKDTHSAVRLQLVGHTCGAQALQEMKRASGRKKVVAQPFYFDLLGTSPCQGNNNNNDNNNNNNNDKVRGIVIEERKNAAPRHAGSGRGNGCEAQPRACGRWSDLAKTWDGVREKTGYGGRDGVEG